MSQEKNSFHVPGGNAVIADIDEEEMLSKAFMEDVKREYSPTQVFIEYNGMWDDSRIQRLVQIFPIDWYLGKEIIFSGRVHQTKDGSNNTISQAAGD